MSFSLIVSVGKYGGFYFLNGDIMKKVCLGWVALYLIVPAYDDVVWSILEKAGCERPV